MLRFFKFLTLQFLVINWFSTLSAVIYSEELQAELEACHTKYSRDCELLFVEQLKISRRLFTVSKSVDSEIFALEKRKKFLTPDGKQKLLKKISGFESWCQESKVNLSLLLESFSNAGFKISEVLQRHGFLEQKYSDLFAGIVVPELENDFEEELVDEQDLAVSVFYDNQRADELAAALAELFSQEQFLSNCEQAAQELKLLNAKILEEQNFLKEIKRRLAVNAKSVFIASQIELCLARIQELEEEKATLLAKVSESQQDPNFISQARAEIAEKKEVLRQELEQIKSGANAQQKFKGAVKKPKTTKQELENDRLIAKLNNLLDKILNSLESGKSNLLEFDAVEIKIKHFYGLFE